MILIIALLALGLAGGGWWWGPLIFVCALEAFCFVWRAIS